MSNPSAIAVENEHNDPVTVAYSALDAAVERFAGSDEEIARISGKVDKLKAEVVAAQDQVKIAKEQKTARAADVAAAQSAVDAAKAKAPDLAAEVELRRDRAKAERIATIEAELARLKEGN